MNHGQLVTEYMTRLLQRFQSLDTMNYRQHDYEISVSIIAVRDMPREYRLAAYEGYGLAAALWFQRFIATQHLRAGVTS